MVKNYIYSEKIKNSTHIGKWGMLHREYLKKKYPLHMKTGKRLINRQIRQRKRHLNMRKS